MGATTTLERRWFCPSCERIFRRVNQRDEQGAGWHPWRCKEPMRFVDVTLTLRPTAPTSEPS